MCDNLEFISTPQILKLETSISIHIMFTNGYLTYSQNNISKNTQMAVAAPEMLVCHNGIMQCAKGSLTLRVHILINGRKW